MKNFYLCLIILILSASCSNDLDIAEETSASTNFKEDNNRSDILSSNSTNPYEIVGQIYEQLATSYYEENNLPHQITDIVKRVEMLVHSNSAFNDLKRNNYQPVTSERVAYIAQHQDVFLTEVLGKSSLSINGKRSLNAFVESLAPFIDSGNDFEALHHYIEEYENSILNNSRLNANDKRIILVGTAIAKHSNYKINSSNVQHSNQMFMKEPKKNTDPDWGVLVGNFKATTEGTDESIAKAISLSLAVNATIND